MLYNAIKITFHYLTWVWAASWPVLDEILAISARYLLNFSLEELRHMMTM